MIDLLTVEKTAALLKPSRQQIRKMIRGSLIPAVRISREWRVNQSYLREFPDQRMADML